MMPRAWMLVSIALMTAPLLAAGAAGQAAFDPVAGPYPYEQPDASGDSTGAAVAQWGDITMLRATTLADGSLLFQMQFVDLARTTGELRYCIFFTIDGDAYQAGYRGQVVNGSPNGATTSCTWNNSGTTVGTPALDASNDIITVTIAPDELGGPAFGTPIAGIVVEIGAVVTGVGQGSRNLFDTLTPSVDPVDFEYGLGAAAPAVAESLALSTTEDRASAAPGQTASFVVIVVNEGDANATFNTTVTGLPHGFDVTVDAANGTVEANGSIALDVTVGVPADADPAEHAFTLHVDGVNGGNATLDLTVVVAADDPSGDGGPDPTDSAGNQTGNGTLQDTEDGGGIPAPGALVVVGVLAAAAFAAGRARRRLGR